MQSDIRFGANRACDVMDLSGRLAVEIFLRSGIEIERKFNG
jgi:hypothetical protein